MNLEPEEWVVIAVALIGVVLGMIIAVLLIIFCGGDLWIRTTGSV
jgi:ABC-type phosphate/phosphonate transport system permease subunit